MEQGQSGMTKEGEERGQSSTLGGVLIRRSLPLAALPGLSWDLMTLEPGRSETLSTLDRGKNQTVRPSSYPPLGKGWLSYSQV